MEQNELMHYGVLGMKWGVHRGNVSTAYGKATAKRKKLENRVVQAKKAYDAEKWVKAMDKTFRDYDVNNLPSEKVDAGRNFTKKIS